MATKNSNLSLNEAAFGRTGSMILDFNDLKTTGFLDGNNQVTLDTVKPGEVITGVSVYVVEAVAGDADLAIDVGLSNDANVDNAIDNVTVGNVAVNTSVHSSALYLGNATAADVTLQLEFTNLTSGSITAGKFAIAWNKSSSPLAQV